MKALYLLDTNIISEPLKAIPNQHVLDLLKLNEGKMVLCAPVLHELCYGMERLQESNRKALIAEYIENVLIRSFSVLSYDSHTAFIHARIRSRLESEGKTTGFVDSQIAAIALANDLILATRNIKDFNNISGLRAENWFIA